MEVNSAAAMVGKRNREIKDFMVLSGVSLTDWGNPITFVLKSQ